MLVYKDRDITKSDDKTYSIGTKFLNFNNVSQSDVVGNILYDDNTLGLNSSMKIKFPDPQWKGFNQLTLTEFNFNMQIPTIISGYNDRIYIYASTVPTTVILEIPEGDYSISSLITKLNDLVLAKFLIIGSLAIVFSYDSTSKRVCIQAAEEVIFYSDTPEQTSLKYGRGSVLRNLGYANPYKVTTIYEGPQYKVYADYGVYMHAIKLFHIRSKFFTSALSEFKTTKSLVQQYANDIIYSFSSYPALVGDDMKLSPDITIVYKPDEYTREIDFEVVDEFENPIPLFGAYIWGRLLFAYNDSLIHS